MSELAITVTNTTGVRGMRPVSGGVPIPEGAAPEGTCFALFDRSGSRVPLQFRVIAHWKDGSARWVLLDFTADPPPHATSLFMLRWGEGISSSSETAPSFVDVSVDGEGLVSISDRFEVSFQAISEDKREFYANVEETSIEADGPVRRTWLIKGSFRDGSGARWFGFRLWVSTFTGSSKMLLEPLVLMDSSSGLVQRIRELALKIVPKGSICSARVGGLHGRMSEVGDEIRLFQVDDTRCIMNGSDCFSGRTPGWVEIDDGAGTAAMALAGFWQQWPKSLVVKQQELKLGLFPQFSDGMFSHLEPWYKFDYLFDGECYRLRTGQARRWQVWLDLAGDGESLAAYVNAPLVPAADPKRALATGVWGRVAPSGIAEMAGYDGWASTAFESYLKAVDDSHDYGAMNWGDWFGERKCNWANNEYDTARQMFLEFARTGDPKYFYRAVVTARHTAEVDTIHFANDDLKSYFIDEVCSSYTNRSITDNYPVRPGMMHAHAVGHTGGFHPVKKINDLFLSFNPGATGNLFLCLDPYNVGHMFAQGLAWCYFLTGDPWIHETLERIGENLAKLVEDRKMPFTGRACAGRELGWPMLALAALYELDFNPRYLNAMKILADDALGEQDQNCGGWLQELTGGHCSCVNRRHIGEASFITAIRLNGLCRYYRLSGDERIPEAVKRGIDNLIEDRWKDEKSGWRYTSCPASFFHGQPGVVMMAMANAVDILQVPEHIRVLQKAWTALFERVSGQGPGKGYAPVVYGAAETACVISTCGSE